MRLFKYINYFFLFLLTFLLRVQTTHAKTIQSDNSASVENQQFIDPIYVSGIVDSIYIDTTSGSGWATYNGQTLTFTFDPPDYPVIINDEAGNQYTIWPDGTIEVSNFLNFSETWDVDSNQVLVFTENSNDIRGFDQKEHIQWHENYEVMLLNDSIPYFVPNKSLASTSSATATSSATEGSIDFILPSNSLGDITFKIDETTAISASGNTITLPNDLSVGNHSIEAYAGGKKIGQANIFVYSKKEKELVLVPIADVSLDASAIKDILDQTLGEANIDVAVTVAPRWNDTLFTTNKTVALPTDVGLLNKYSDDMRDLRDAYFDDFSAFIQEGAYYLFVVAGLDSSGSSSAVDGYMVRGKSLGFVASSAPILTYAHELGHGIGALNHSWKDNGPGKGNTSNLMDYAGGDNLTKAQWKELRDFDLLPSMWDEVEDGLLRTPKCIDSFNLIGNFCMQDMICSVSKYTQFYNSNNNSLRWQDSIIFKFFSDSTFQNLNTSYLWKYNGSGQKSWTITSSTSSSFVYSFNPEDTLVCDRRITSYCNTTIPVIIPSLPPKVFDYLVYIAYPLDVARPGKNDYSAGAIAYRALMGTKKIQVGHTGICFVKSDTILKRAKIDYYDFGRFNSLQSKLGNGIRRHYDLGYLKIAVDDTDSTYKLIYKDSIEIKINNISYFSGHLDKYGRKELAFVPLSRSDFNNAFSLATSPFYSVRDFGFGTNKSFCTDFVHDTFNAGGIPMADISLIVSNFKNRLAMTSFLISKDKDPFLMNYWDAGDSFLRDINKSPLPINYSIYLQNKYPKFN